MKKLHIDWKQAVQFSWKDTAITVAVLLCSVLGCLALRFTDSMDGFVTPVFVLAVLLISRFTNGYFYGFAAAILGVVCVNYVFTYPYFTLDFTIAGYPFSFLVFFAVSSITCALTAQAKQKEELRVENERVKMRANLLRSVSHDIRTPLTSIVGATSAVLENPNVSPAEQRELLEEVRGEAQWLIQVVENLLSITRMGDDKADIKKQMEAPEEILAVAVGKFRKRYPDVKVSVKVPDVFLMVPMDAILVEQVLANLMENAAIHGEHTTQIDIRVETKQDFAEFTVSDNGKGIPEGEMDTLFDGTMKHSETSGGDIKRNMGIGLSVCLAIVNAHGGQMTACNREEGGAEFAFTLPME